MERALCQSSAYGTNLSPVNNVVSEVELCTVQTNCQSLTSSWMSMSVMPLLLSSSCMLEMAALFPGTL